MKSLINIINLFPRVKSFKYMIPRMFSAMHAAAQHVRASAHFVTIIEQGRAGRRPEIILSSRNR